MLPEPAPAYGVTMRTCVGPGGAAADCALRPGQAAGVGRELGSDSLCTRGGFAASATTLSPPTREGSV